MRTPTEVDGCEASQAGHGVGGFQLSPVPEQDVEDVVLGAGAQGALVQAAAHQLAVLDHHDYRGMGGEYKDVIRLC